MPRNPVIRLLDECAVGAFVFGALMLVVAVLVSPGAVNATVGTWLVGLVLVALRWRLVASDR